MSKGINKALPWLLAALLGIGAGWLWQPSSGLPSLGQPEASREAGGLFSEQGAVSLHETPAALQVVYIGYMSCPDICPTALSRLGAALHQLPAEQLRQVRPLFVSVDPKRDTVQNLALYSGYFHPAIIGTTGERRAIDALVSRLQAYYRMVPLGESAMAYTVDHSANYYLLDSQGKLLETLPDNLTPEQLVASMAHYL